MLPSEPNRNQKASPAKQFLTGLKSSMQNNRRMPRPVSNQRVQPQRAPVFPANIEVCFNGLKHSMMWDDLSKNFVLLTPNRSPPSTMHKETRIPGMLGVWNWCHDGSTKNGQITIYQNGQVTGANGWKGGTWKDLGSASLPRNSYGVPTVPQQAQHQRINAQPVIQPGQPIQSFQIANSVPSTTSNRNMHCNRGRRMNQAGGAPHRRGPKCKVTARQGCLLTLMLMCCFGAGLVFFACRWRWFSEHNAHSNCVDDDCFSKYFPQVSHFTGFPNTLCKHYSLYLDQTGSESVEACTQRCMDLRENCRTAMFGYSNKFDDNGSTCYLSPTECEMEEVYDYGESTAVYVKIKSSFRKVMAPLSGVCPSGYTYETSVMGVTDFSCVGTLTTGKCVLTKQAAYEYCLLNTCPVVSETIPLDPLNPSVEGHVRIFKSITTSTNPSWSSCIKTGMTQKPKPTFEPIAVEKRFWHWGTSTRREGSHQ